MTGAQEEDKKVCHPVGPVSDLINLKVTGEEGNEAFFRIKKSTQLKMLMNAYCDRYSVELSSRVFLFDGRKIGAEQTPNGLEMEEGDEIDAMLFTDGGATTT